MLFSCGSDGTAEPIGERAYESILGYPRSDIRDNTRVDRIAIVRDHNKRLNTRRFIAHEKLLMISNLPGIGDYVYFLAVPRHTRTVFMSSARSTPPNSAFSIPYAALYLWP